MTFPLRAAPAARLALLAALAGGPSLADDPGLCDLARSLDARIVEVTAYAPAPGCPEISFDLPAAPAAAQRSQAGAYDPATGAIALAPDLDLAGALGQSYLLHELVHAAQFRAGRQHRVTCAAVLEAEAYAIQADFLHDRGESREAMLMRLLAGQLGHCPADPGS